MRRGAFYTKFSIITSEFLIFLLLVNVSLPVLLLVFLILEGVLCPLLYCTRYCIISGTVLYQVLYCTVWNCTALNCTELYSTTTAVLCYCTVLLYCCTLYCCTVLRCTALHRTILNLLYHTKLLYTYEKLMRIARCHVRILKYSSCSILYTTVVYCCILLIQMYTVYYLSLIHI